MAEASAPTYTTEHLERMTLWICLIPDAGSESGICGHKSRDEGLAYQHACQRHAGVFIKAPDEAEGEDGQDLDTRDASVMQDVVDLPTDTPSSPRTPASLEAPPSTHPPATPVESVPVAPPHPPEEAPQP